MAAGAQTGAPEYGKTAWLSRGFEELLHGGKLDYDVIIVGSGYGGAIAAAELAGCTQAGKPVTVCVLERGREYLPGMFPASLADLPSHVRFSNAGSAQSRGRREGLFDIRIGDDLNAVVANGLGGGSLINAGVMARPRDEVFADWPQEIKGALDEMFREASACLGADTRFHHPAKDDWPAKLLALEKLASRSSGTFGQAAITVARTRKGNGEGVVLEACKRCGDCATGCNHGAKNSLDVNLLFKAWRAGAGAVIVTGATVLRIERDKRGIWLVHTVYTDEQLRKRQGEPATLRAGKLILAAGTFGSTEILLRSQSEALRFSSCLGQRFSSNGDAIAVVYGQRDCVNAVADERLAPEERVIGPTITGMVDLRGPDGKGHVIQELAIPAALRRVFEETVTTAKTLHELERSDEEDHAPDGPAQDPCAVDAAAIARTSVVVVMGDDGAGGSLELVGGDGVDEGDGAARVRWPALRDKKLFSDQIEQLARLVRDAGAGGRVLPNPVWQILPASMQFLFDDRRGPLLTVHPLGGCAVGTDARDGVVNHLGQVFDAASGGARRDLVVLDGSIVRGALGINPALTIAALALRAVRELRDRKEQDGGWGFRPPRPDDKPEVVRPRFRDMPAPERIRPTELEIIERMSGYAKLKAKGGGKVACRVELTLPFRSHRIDELVLPVGGKPVPMARILRVDEGKLRVFRKEAWDAWRQSGEPESRLEDSVELQAAVKGELTLLQREPTTVGKRRRRAYWAWIWNRGLRDTWQALAQRWSDGQSIGASGLATPGDRQPLSFWGEARKRVSGARALASRAGEVRQLRYTLRLEGDGRYKSGTPIDAGFRHGEPVEGVKRLTYARKSNPWRQLMQMSLCEFPCLAQRGAVLELDTKFLAEKRVPLFKLTAQHDQVAALADLVALAGYFLRLLLNIHVWSFRRPDEALVREPQRLPQAIEGRLPEPRVREIELERLEDGTPVQVRLTRYRPRAPVGRPVVMIHGYSASGTTFAHHAVKPNMAEYFFARRRDVWVLDLRTSSGMPTARHPWTFEDAALADIPVAIEEIWRETGEQPVDVFAHCMGAAMFSMAVLAQPEPGDRFFGARLALPGQVRRAVLSQIAPVVVMSPANIFRGYAMSYLRHFLPLANYQFRVGPDPGLVDQLIDRLLATLPYPEEEFNIENPRWPPCRRTRFVGTRHRMDALYGRDFSLADKKGRALINDEVLEYIDDLFGPLNIDTVAQGIHFARSELITSRAGRNEYVLPDNLPRWRFPTASIHGAENGLSDVATLARFQKRFKEDAGIDIETVAFGGFGHQDCLIGKNARQVFDYAFEFLSAEDQNGRRRH